MKLMVTVETSGYMDNKDLAKELIKVANDLVANPDGGYHKDQNWEWYIEMD